MGRGSSRGRGVGRRNENATRKGGRRLDESGSRSDGSSGSSRDLGSSSGRSRSLTFLSEESRWRERRESGVSDDSWPERKHQSRRV